MEVFRRLREVVLALISSRLLPERDISGKTSSRQPQTEAEGIQKRGFIIKGKNKLVKDSKRWVPGRRESVGMTKEWMSYGIWGI